jgi:hypothetical protein
MCLNGSGVVDWLVPDWIGLLFSSVIQAYLCAALEAYMVLSLFQPLPVPKPQRAINTQITNRPEMKVKRRRSVASEKRVAETKNRPSRASYCFCSLRVFPGQPFSGLAKTPY